ncbi:hypothetical protein Tco_0050258 [Tanacetum coccineum]
MRLNISFELTWAYGIRKSTWAYGIRKSTSGFKLTAFSGFKLTWAYGIRKSTSGGIPFLGADLFTKALLEEKFKYLVCRLGMRCLTPEELEVLANESA